MILWTHNDFLSRRMRYPVWIHCCKRPNYDFWISQGTVATVLRWGGKTVVIYANFLHDGVCQKLQKNRPIFRGVIQKITLAQFFLRHGVYFRNSPTYRSDSSADFRARWRKRRGLTQGCALWGLKNSKWIFDPWKIPPKSKFGPKGSRWVTWPMTSRDPKRSRSWPQYVRSWISH